MDRQERLRRQTEVERLIEEVGPRLLALPGVKSLAAGLKVSGGTRTSEIVLRVGVIRKRPLSELPPEQQIPAEINGIRTDVFVWQPVVKVADTARYRPVMGGIQIGNGTGAVGTLGCFAKRNVQDDWVALSNQHVMYAGKSATATGIEIAQPDFNCCCCCRSGKIGDVLAGVGATGGAADAAICSLLADIVPLQEVVEIGGITGTAVAVLGDAVRKRGRSTGLTRGTVSMVGFTGTADGHSMTGQIVIDVDSAFPSFVEPGDSGSALLNEDNEVVGLIWGKLGSQGIASTIAAVESELDITVVAQTGATTARPQVARMPPPGSDGVVRRRDWEAMLWAELGAPDPFARKLNRHWSEVWSLIQTNREVGLRWQRGQGPAFTAAFERTTRVSRYSVPDEIDGVSLTQLLLSMAAALEQHGSPELRADIRRDAIGWLPHLQTCRTADALWLEYQQIKRAAQAIERNTG